MSLRLMKKLVKAEPVLFISHGAPDILLSSSEATKQWQSAAANLQPVGIIIVSAHWEAAQVTVSSQHELQTMYDFQGFPPELYKLKYPARSTDSLQKLVTNCLSQSNVPFAQESRGLDHGAWVPLLAMFPNADVPVIQVSLVKNGSSEQHYQLGKALSGLRQQGILIITSGAITHNFKWLDKTPNAKANPRAQEFADLVSEQIGQKRYQEIMNYRLKQIGVDAHPEQDHFSPIIVALGATSEGDEAKRYQPAASYGLTMDWYVWGQ